MALRRGVMLAVVAALSAVGASLTLRTDGKLYASGGIGDEDGWEDEDDEPRVFGSFSLQPAADDSHPARGAGDGPDEGGAAVEVPTLQQPRAPEQREKMEEELHREREAQKRREEEGIRLWAEERRAEDEKARAKALAEAKAQAEAEGRKPATRETGVVLSGGEDPAARPAVDALHKIFVEVKTPRLSPEEVQLLTSQGRIVTGGAVVLFDEHAPFDAPLAQAAELERQANDAVRRFYDGFAERNARGELAIARLGDKRLPGFSEDGTPEEGALAPGAFPSLAVFRSPFQRLSPRHCQSLAALHECAHNEAAMLEHCRAECADIEQGGAALSKHALHSTLTKSHAQGGGSFFSEEDVGHLCNVIDVAATSEAAWALVRAGTSAPLQHLLLTRDAGAGGGRAGAASGRHGRQGGRLSP